MRLSEKEPPYFIGADALFAIKLNGGPEGRLLRVLKAEGARLTYHDSRNGAILVRYELPG